MRVLVAPDKFKGSLSALEVAEAVGAGLASVGVDASLLPVADGGDGSVAAALHAGFSARHVRVHGADNRWHDTVFAFDGTTAVVEVANTCGLATLTELAPMTASSRGFGEAVAAALAAGARRVVLCLGGSASTDGGAGMLNALGVRFEGFPADGNLRRITGVSGRPDLGGVELVVATDVVTPLLQAATVFGPQKGATPEQVVELEARLAHFARLLGSPSLADEPGTGAAGGVGFACRWLGARRVAGAEYFLDLVGFDRALDGCAAVITGEGRLDGQTAAGKLPAVVAARAAPRPVSAVVGQSLLTEEEHHRLGLRDVLALADLSTEDPSRDAVLSRRLCEEAGARLGRKISTTFCQDRPRSP
ncbi:glycerate kinase [Amycolatopsis sp. 195334CR]|uniref:glycerate kinase n=1 Tax=Amycolatopsis sp. 195334CR TaxID=2814588 RepID=UPI001A8D5926|nr:glycerate kinase [Amycolatopsis sp. 195334CR]MBN6041131.1 glycerate kinase [Amycolatopsis sp. 195334CR]